VLWNLLGAANEAQGKLEEAIAAYNKALLIKPDFVEAHNNIGLAFQALGKLEEAFSAYNKALLIKPDFVEAHNNIGLAFQALGKLDEAVAAYNKALLIKPDFVEAHNNIANALRDLGKLEEAVAAYNKALLIKPDFVEAHNNIANALRDLGKLEEAILSYTEAIKVNPSQSSAHCALGDTLMELGKYEEAVVSYTHAIRLKSDFAEAHKNMGLALHLQGCFIEAKAAYELCIAINSEPGLAHVYLKSLCNKEKEPNVSVPVDVPEAQRENEIKYPGLRIWTRPVEEALVDFVCTLPALTPKDQLKNGLHKYSAGVGIGNMTVSKNWQVLNINKSIIKKLEADLRETCLSLLNSEIFISESFVNYNHGKSQIVKHNHYGKIDEELAISSQKFSLVYYLRIGDKNAVQPGILKLYNPDLSIHPEQGMIILFPAITMHSALYSGTEERIVAGANFYTI